MNRRGWWNILFVFPEAGVSVVKDVKYDAIRLERLKNKPGEDGGISKL